MVESLIVVVVKKKVDTIYFVIGCYDVRLGLYDDNHEYFLYHG